MMDRTRHSLKCANSKKACGTSPRALYTCSTQSKEDTSTLLLPLFIDPPYKFLNAILVATLSHCIQQSYRDIPDPMILTRKVEVEDTRTRSYVYSLAIV